MFTVDFEQINADWLNMEIYFTHVPFFSPLCHENIRTSNGFQVFSDIIIIEQCEGMG